VIGRCLRLNEDLIEAIALGHDLGHSPYGHDGEKVLDEICRENKIGSFCHSAQSVRLLRDIEKKGEGLNITLQVLDGILCHNGEILDKRYMPAEEKEWDAFLSEYQACLTDSEHCKKVFPMTMEGCVVRIADVIAYIGRDIEDAITIRLIQRNSIPTAIRAVLGDANDKIINTLVMNLIKQSYDKPYLEFSDDVSKALKDLKAFNYEYIYSNPKIRTESAKIVKMFRDLFDAYCKHIREADTSQDIYRFHLNDMNNKYKQVPVERQVIDFMSGMTDDFFNNQYQKIFVPQSYGYGFD
jgi:dGTPase